VGRKKLGDTLDVESLVEDYLRDCMCLGDLPTVKDFAWRVGLTPVTLYRRYLEATGNVLSEVLRERHSEHLRRLKARRLCFESVAELTGYSCGRAVRRRLRVLEERARCGAPSS
jgi:AraC-like DNA-binding protein